MHHEMHVGTKYDGIPVLVVSMGAGLPVPVTQEAIRKVFDKYGEITHVKTGNKDFIFIDYRDIESCERAIKAMNNQPFDEHSTGSIQVKWADENRIRAQDGGGGGGGYRRDDKREDRFKDGAPLERRRSRSPVGRGGGGGGGGGGGVA